MSVRHFFSLFVLSAMILVSMVRDGQGYVLCGFDWTYNANPMGEDFLVNPNCNEPDVTNEIGAVIAAADTWNTQGCAQFFFTYGGTTSDTESGFDGRNSVMWVNYDIGSLATAFYWVDGGTSNILEADTVFNDHAVNWDDSGSPSCSQQEFDIQSIMTHEFGHYLCLGHTSDPGTVMYSLATPCDLSKRNLSPDDIAGIQAIYGDRCGGVPSQTRFTDSVGGDAHGYVIGWDQVFVTVSDLDEAGGTWVQALISNAASGDVEIVPLDETIPGSFRSSYGLSTNSGTVGTPGDGFMTGLPGDGLFAQYTDPDDPQDVSSDTATMLGASAPASIRFTDEFDQDRSSYMATQDAIFISLKDSDENENPLGLDAVTVEVQNPVNGDQEEVLLMETGYSTGHFRSATGLDIICDTAGNPGNGLLESSGEEIVLAIYQDAQDPNDQSRDTASVVGCGEPDGIQTDISFFTPTGMGKSQLMFEIEYANLSSETLGDNETVDPRLRVKLFNGKSGGDFSSLLPSIPVLSPGATHTTGPLFATVPKTSIKKIQKLLNSNLRAWSDVLENGSPVAVSDDCAPFRITERNEDNIVVLIQNDESQDVDASDGFGGIDSEEDESDGVNNTGNEGFFAVSMPNQGNEAIGTRFILPDRIGDGSLMEEVTFSAATFGPSAPAQVAMYRSVSGGEPDWDKPVFGPIAFTPVAAEASMAGDHFNSISFSSATTRPSEVVHLVFFFSEGSYHGLGIDNPYDSKCGNASVSYEATFASSDGYQTYAPVSGNWVAKLTVRDIPGGLRLNTGGDGSMSLTEGGVSTGSKKIVLTPVTRIDGGVQGRLGRAAQPVLLRRADGRGLGRPR